jgi:transcriptional regulator with XRE-family HTH domain
VISEHREPAPDDEDDGAPPTAADQAYNRSVGLRLRAIRVRRGLSLRQVEAGSGARLTRAAIGSYERGTRVASVGRLAELADFYRVPLETLLPGEGSVAPSPLPGLPARVVIDLLRLQAGGNATSRGDVRFIAAVLERRADYGSSLVEVRRSDLRALALMHGVSLDTLIQEWRASGVAIRRDDASAEAATGP